MLSMNRNIIHSVEKSARLMFKAVIPGTRVKYVDHLTPKATPTGARKELFKLLKQGQPGCFFK